jgi:hypothetical protein
MHIVSNGGNGNCGTTTVRRPITGKRGATLWIDGPLGSATDDAIPQESVSWRSGP